MEFICKYNTFFLSKLSGFSTKKRKEVPHGVVVNVLNCNIIVSVNSSCAIMFTFGLIPFYEDAFNIK